MAVGSSYTVVCEIVVGNFSWRQKWLSVFLHSAREEIGRTKHVAPVKLKLGMNGHSGSWTMCMDMCIDICIYMCIDICIGMCIDNCLGTCTDTCTNMCTAMYVETSTEM